MDFHSLAVSKLRLLRVRQRRTIAPGVSEVATFIVADRAVVCPELRARRDPTHVAHPVAPGDFGCFPVLSTERTVIKLCNQHDYEFGARLAPDRH